MKMEQRPLSICLLFSLLHSGLKHTNVWMLAVAKILQLGARVQARTVSRVWGWRLWTLQRMTPTYWALTSKQSEICTYCSILEKKGNLLFSTAGCWLITQGVRGAALTSRMETAALKCGAWVRGPTPQTILAPPQQRTQAMMLFHLI